MPLRAVHHHTHPYTLTLLLSGLVKGTKIHPPCFVFRKRMQKQQDMNCICKLHRIQIHISKSMNIAYCPSVLLADSHVQCSSNLLSYCHASASGTTFFSLSIWKTICILCILVLPSWYRCPGGGVSPGVDTGCHVALCPLSLDTQASRHQGQGSTHTEYSMLNLNLSFGFFPHHYMYFWTLNLKLT